jgi:hypothetical protein
MKIILFSTYFELPINANFKAVNEFDKILGILIVSASNEELLKTVIILLQILGVCQ